MRSAQPHYWCKTAVFASSVMRDDDPSLVVYPALSTLAVKRWLMHVVSIASIALEGWNANNAADWGMRCKH